MLESGETGYSEEMVYGVVFLASFESGYITSTEVIIEGRRLSSQWPSATGAVLRLKEPSVRRNVQGNLEIHLCELEIRCDVHNPQNAVIRQIPG